MVWVRADCMSLSFHRMYNIKLSIECGVNIEQSATQKYKWNKNERCIEYTKRMSERMNQCLPSSMYPVGWRCLTLASRIKCFDCCRTTTGSKLRMPQTNDIYYVLRQGNYTRISEKYFVFGIILKQKRKEKWVTTPLQSESIPTYYYIYYTFSLSCEDRYEFVLQRFD